MTKSCCAANCVTRFQPGSGIGFFTFPKDPQRRQKWINALNRKEWKGPSKHTVICGLHFQTRRPSSDPKHPDYVPNVFSFKNPVRKRTKQSRKVLNEDPKNVFNDDNQSEDKPIYSEVFSTCDINIKELSEVLKMKSEIDKQTTETVNVEEGSNELLDTDATESACESFGEEEDEYLSLKLELYEAYTDINNLKKEKDVIYTILSASEAEQKILKDSVSEKEKELSKLKIELQQAYEEINVLRSEKDAMQKKVASSDITNRILQDPKELYFYTGIHSTKDFHSILALIYDVDTSNKLFPMTTQLLIVLMKLRLNLLYSDLSFRFQTSRNTVQRLCVKMIPCLEEKLELLIKCPVTNALKKTLPPCYKNTVFESLYNRIQKFVKSEAKQCENEDADCENM